MSLTGMVALVTGGASGIGASCVEEFLKENVKGVVIADINNNEELIKNLSEKYGDRKVAFIKTNVGIKESFKNAFEKAIEYFNQLDILINCAAISGEDQWEKLIQINLVGTTYGCLLAINEYFPKYKNSNGFVINIASAAGVIPVPVFTHYTSAKHGVVGLTRAIGLRKDVIEKGIHIMALCPGATETPMLQKGREDFAEEMRAFPPQKPEAVAKSAVKLIANPENASVWLINEGILSKIDLPEWGNLEKLLIAS